MTQHNSDALPLSPTAEESLFVDEPQSDVKDQKDDESQANVSDQVDEPMPDATANDYESKSDDKEQAQEAQSPVSELVDDTQTIANKNVDDQADIPTKEAPPAPDYPSGSLTFMSADKSTLVEDTDLTRQPATAEGQSDKDNRHLEEDSKVKARQLCPWLPQYDWDQLLLPPQYPNVKVVEESKARVYDSEKDGHEAKRAEDKLRAVLERLTKKPPVVEQPPKNDEASQEIEKQGRDVAKDESTTLPSTRITDETEPILAAEVHNEPNNDSTELEPALQPQIPAAEVITRASEPAVQKAEAEKVDSTLDITIQEPDLVTEAHNYASDVVASVPEPAVEEVEAAPSEKVDIEMDDRRGAIESTTQLQLPVADAIVGTRWRAIHESYDVQPPAEEKLDYVSDSDSDEPGSVRNIHPAVTNALASAYRRNARRDTEETKVSAEFGPSEPPRPDREQSSGSPRGSHNNTISPTTPGPPFSEPFTNQSPTTNKWCPAGRRCENVHCPHGHVAIGVDPKSWRVIFNLDRRCIRGLNCKDSGCRFWHESPYKHRQPNETRKQWQRWVNSREEAWGQLPVNFRDV